VRLVGNPAGWRMKARTPPRGRGQPGWLAAACVGGARWVAAPVSWRHANRWRRCPNGPVNGGGPCTGTVPTPHAKDWVCWEGRARRHRRRPPVAPAYAGEGTPPPRLYRDRSLTGWIDAPHLDAR